MPVLRFAATLAVLWILLSTPHGATAQVLDLMRHEVRDGDDKPADNSSNSPGPTKPASPCDDDDGFDLDGRALEVAGAALLVPYWGPFVLLGDDFGKPESFLRYPYWHNQPGSMMVPPPDAALRPWEAEIGFEYSSNLDQLSRYAGHLRVSTSSRIDVETNWNSFQERTRVGRDQVSIGDFDVLFRFAQSETVQFRSGLGANWFDDCEGVVGGFNFRYGVDWFPVKPLAFSAVVDLGELGKADMLHARATGGIVWHRWQLYSGCDYRSVGAARFFGPVAGLQFKF